MMRTKFALLDVWYVILERSSVWGGEADAARLVLSALRAFRGYELSCDALGYVHSNEAQIKADCFGSFHYLSSILASRPWD